MIEKLSLDKVLLLDCDVEKPNAHIFLKPEIEAEKQVYIKVLAIVGYRNTVRLSG